MTHIVVLDFPDTANEIGRALSDKGHNVYMFSDYATFITQFPALPHIDLIVSRDNLRPRTDEQFSFADNMSHIEDIKTNTRYKGLLADVAVLGHTIFQYRLEDKPKLDKLLTHFIYAPRTSDLVEMASSMVPAPKYPKGVLYAVDASLFKLVV